MKKLILLPFLVLLAIACTKDRSSTSEVTPAEKKKCAASGNYAKSVDEATKRIIGTWKMTFIKSGWGTDSTPEELRLTFKANGTCIVVQKDSTYAPVSFSMKMLNLDRFTIEAGVSGLVPFLTVNDSLRIYGNYRQVRSSVLIICEEEMLLEYGVRIREGVTEYWYDTPLYTFRRESDAQ